MIEVRSYRAVFDLERRIYRVDQLRLNPGGVPVRGIVYCLAILLGILILGSLPLLGPVIGALPWYARDLALPLASATLLSVVRIEGRPFHLAAGALLRQRFGARRLTGILAAAEHSAGGEPKRWRPEEILLLPDGSDAAMRRLRYTGPGAVLLMRAHEPVEPDRSLRCRLGNAHALSVRELPGREVLSGGEVIVLAAGSRLELRSTAIGQSRAGAPLGGGPVPEDSRGREPG